MPTIYCLSCEHCDREGETHITYDGFAGAVFTSDQSGGTIISEGYLAYLDANGSLVTLPHPIEHSSLQGQGDKWSNATINGRVFDVTNLICRQCSAINPSPRLKCHTDVGCLIGIVLAIVTGVLLKLLTPMPVPLIFFPRAWPPSCQILC